jgi:hypothetical protein
MAGAKFLSWPLSDAGPLMAALNGHDEHHGWAVRTLERLGPPFDSCPEAMVEVGGLDRSTDGHQGNDRGRLGEQAAAVLRLLNECTNLVRACSLFVRASPGNTQVS